MKEYGADDKQYIRRPTQRFEAAMSMMRVMVQRGMCSKALMILFVVLCLRVIDEFYE